MKILIQLTKFQWAASRRISSVSMANNATTDKVWYHTGIRNSVSQNDQLAKFQRGERGKISPVFTLFIILISLFSSNVLAQIRKDISLNTNEVAKVQQFLEYRIVKGLIFIRTKIVTLKVKLYSA